MPMWDFELTFDGLDMTATGDYGALGAQSMQTLAGFFLQCQGKANPFIYVDPTDNTRHQRASRRPATASPRPSPSSRPMGEFSEPVGALISVTGVYSQRRAGLRLHRRPAQHDHLRHRRRRRERRDHRRLQVRLRLPLHRRRRRTSKSSWRC